ncbi:MAG: mechanosensitive ion channel [Gammaproteobacteria bacterium]|nr:mechanosensitive ion channel [Gammaproteobacteria bacterium]
MLQENYKYKKIITIALCSLIVSLLSIHSSNSFAEFNANQAIDQLSILRDELNDKNINERNIKNIREESTQLRASALNCIDEVDPQVQSLKDEVEALEQINPDVEIEIYARLTKARDDLRQEDTDLKNCSLTVVRSTRLIDLSNKLLNELTTELLSEKGKNILDAITSIPEQIIILPELFFDQTLKKINQDTIIFLVLMLLLGFSFGFFFGDQIKKIQYNNFFKSLNRQLILDLRTLFKPFGRVQAPFLLGALGLTAALSLSLTSGPNESWLIRLTISPIIISLSYVVINWVTGSLSPAPINEEIRKEDAKSLKNKLKFLTLVLVSSYIVFGPEWLASDTAANLSLIRISIVSLIILSMISVLTSVSKVFSLNGEYGILKFLGYSALGISFSAELSGFHNLSSFILSGFIITLFSSYIFWSLLSLNEKSAQWINTSTNIIGIRMRGFLNISRDQGKSKLGVYQLFFDALFWIGFLMIIFQVWDPTGTVLGTISSYATDGIPMGDIRIIPTNIIAGIIAFVVLTAITGWVKVWIEKRWLRQITADRGARDALVTIVGYAGFTISLLVGLSIGGINITGLAVVAGALSVGIGFGLQSIANNFVSGIILLFERPIKSGDFISVGDVEGYVRKISIRATEIETLDNQDMLIPNAELVSGRVTNWVLHNPYGRLKLKIGVAYGSDVKKVISILQDIASSNSQVITDGRASPPKALFMGFGDSSLEFELRVRILDIKKRYDVLSELNLGVNDAFIKEDIEIPFPQRDIHIKDWSEKNK